MVKERENFLEAREMNIFDLWTRRQHGGDKADTMGRENASHAQSWEIINEGINQSNRAGSLQYKSRAV